MEECHELDSVELKKPAKWAELPIELWLKVSKLLSNEDLNNLHLVSKDFHQILNIIPQVLIITYAIYNENSAFVLKNATRNFNIIKIQKVQHMSDYFDVLFTNITSNDPRHITTFELNDVGLNKLMLVEILRQLTNLKKLKLCWVRHVKTKKSKIITADGNDTIELPHLEDLEISHCEFAHQKILNVISKCNLTEGVFKGVSASVLILFLKSQQKAMKRLTIEHTSVSSQMDLVSLTELNLEYLNLSYRVLGGNGNLVADFLKTNSKLKRLILKTIDINDSIINDIFDSLRSLEELEIEINSNVTALSLNNIYKLTKLRKLVYIEEDEGYQYCYNKLPGLQYAPANENLEEIKIKLPYLTDRFVSDLKTSIPNLKRLHLTSYSPDTIHYFLKHFKNLEHLEITHHYYYYNNNNNNQSAEISVDDVYLLKLKYLAIHQNNLKFDSKTSRKIVNNFSNLENFHIDYCNGLTEKSVKILLKGLKKLKELHIHKISDDTEKGFANSTIINIKKYGRNLKRVHIHHKFDFEYVREMLKDLKGLHISGYDFNTII